MLSFEERVVCCSCVICGYRRRRLCRFQCAAHTVAENDDVVLPMCFECSLGTRVKLRARTKLSFIESQIFDLNWLQNHTNKVSLRNNICEYEGDQSDFYAMWCLWSRFRWDHRPEHCCCSDPVPRRGDDLSIINVD